jgi:RNA-binding protein
MTLTEAQKRQLRRLGHTPRPVVTIGNAGLTEPVMREIDPSLEHHDLMKIRVHAATRKDRDILINATCRSCSTELVQGIGHTPLVYRQWKERTNGGYGSPRAERREGRVNPAAARALYQTPHWHPGHLSPWRAGCCPQSPAPYREGWSRRTAQMPCRGAGQTVRSPPHRRRATGQSSVTGETAP